MGCSYSTCQLSNLPIKAGDRVKILLLSQSPFSGTNFTHSYDYNSLFDIIALPLSGVADNYGGLDSVDINTESKLFNEWLFSTYANIKYNDKKITKLDLVTYFSCTDKHITVNCIYKDTLLTNSDHNLYSAYKEKGIAVTDVDFSSEIEYRELPIRFCFILESVWDSTVEMIGNLTQWEFLNFGDGCANVKESAYSHLTVTINKWTDPLDLESMLNNRYLIPFVNSNAIIKHLQSQNQSAIKSVIDTTFITLFLNWTRKAICPTSGYGSQNEHYQLYKQFAELIIQECDSKSIKSL